VFFLIACLADLKDQDFLNSEVPGSAVSKLTEDTFEAFVKHGNSFVEFYAPWCGHCKHFARSWEEIGQEAQLKGVRVAKVDATIEKTTAGRYGVKGFPSLLFFRDGVPREYKGPRNKDAVLRFCDRVIADMVLAASPKSHVALRDAEPVTFVILCGSLDCRKAKATLEKAAYDLADQAVGFMFVEDAALAREYLPSREDDTVSQLVRYRVGDYPLLFVGHITTEGIPEPTEVLVEWLGQNRFPMVTEISDGYAYSALAKQGKYIALGIYAGNKKDPVKKMLGRASRLQEDKFAFGILKAEDWDSFISKRFGLGPLPRIIVLDGDNVHFELKGELDTSGAGDAVFMNLLTNVYEGKVQSDAREMLSPPYNFWQRLTRYGVVNAVQNHWVFLSLVVLAICLSVWGFWMLCKEPTASEIRGVREEVPNLKTKVEKED